MVETPVAHRDAAAGRDAVKGQPDIAKKRAFMGFKSLLGFVFGALSVAACTAHNGFAGLPTAGSVGPALLTSAEPTSIPLIANAGRKSGFHVQLSIAGTPAKGFLFDTGSGGLWVYANTIAKPKKPVRDLHIAAQNTYGSGLHYDGEVVETTADFGNGLSATLPLVRVDKAYCVTSGCTKKFGKGNIILLLEKERRLWGTMGADLQPKPVSQGPNKSDLYNLLFALGNVWTRFAVTPKTVLASPSETGFTTLDMLPGPKTNQPLPNGAKSWQRNVDVCYSIRRADASAKGSIFNGCLTTVFDTGEEAGVTLNTEDASKLPTESTNCGSILKPGKLFAANAPGESGALLTQFAAGVKQNWNEVLVATPQPSARPNVNTGITFYNRNEISFDAVHGRVGLKPLDPPAHNFESDCAAGAPKAASRYEKTNALRLRGRDALRALLDSAAA
jgi:hypothetical protein